MLNAAKPLEPVKDVVQYFAFKGISRDRLLRRRGPSAKRGAITGNNDDERDETEDDARTCKEAVNHIVTRLKLQCSEAGSGWDVGDKRFVVDDDVRSLGEAERETSWSSRIEYGISTLQTPMGNVALNLADACSPVQNASCGPDCPGPPLATRPSRDTIYSTM